MPVWNKSCSFSLKENIDVINICDIPLDYIGDTILDWVVEAGSKALTIVFAYRRKLYLNVLTHTLELRLFLKCYFESHLNITYLT